MLSSASNRKSSDSWNSSNYEGADDLEWEWKPEQTRLLSRVSIFDAFYRNIIALPCFPLRHVHSMLAGVLKYRSRLSMLFPHTS